MTSVGAHAAMSILPARRRREGASPAARSARSCAAAAFRAADPRGASRMAMAAAAPAVQQDVAAPRSGSIVIPDGELIILRIKPSLWMLFSGLFIPYVVGLLLAFGIFDAVTGLSRGISFRLPIIDWTFSLFLSRLGAAVVLVCLAISIGRLVEWWARIYVLTDRRIVIQSGALRQVTIDFPLRRIQHVSMVRNVENRVLSVGSLRFSTAGPTGEFAWHMISRPEHRLRIVRESIERYARNGSDA